MQKVKRELNKDYKTWIETLPCIACLVESNSVGNWEDNISEAHHVNEKGKSTMGGKTDDTRTIPLCNHHHRLGHLIGWQTFCSNIGLDFEYIITELNRIWKEIQWTSG